MKLSNINKNDDSVTQTYAILSEYFPISDIVLAKSSSRSQHNHYQPLNESLIGNMGSAIALRTKAMGMIPADVKKSPKVQTLIRLANDSDVTIGDVKEMSKWWDAFRIIMGSLLNDEYRNFMMSNNNQIFDQVIKKTKEEVIKTNDKLMKELENRRGETSKDRGDEDEIDDLRRKLRKSKKINDLKTQYGGGKIEKMKTIANLLGLKNTDDMDPDTIIDLLQNARSSDRYGRSRSMLDRILHSKLADKLNLNTGKKSKSEDIFRTQVSLSEGLASWLGDLAHKHGSKLKGLFRSSTDEVGEKAFISAVKLYLVAFAISTFFTNVDAVAAKMANPPIQLKNITPKNKKPHRIKIPPLPGQPTPPLPGGKGPSPTS